LLVFFNEFVEALSVFTLNDEEIHQDVYLFFIGTIDHGIDEESDKFSKLYNITVASFLSEEPFMVGEAVLKHFMEGFSNFVSVLSCLWAS
jgi:hypothetical protein